MTDKKVHDMEEMQEIEVVQDEQVFTLSRPFVFEGETYKKLKLDFERLTGEDIISAENEMRAYHKKDFEFIPVMGFHVPFQAAVAAKAAGVFIGVINKLPARDFQRICQKAQAFLLSTD